MHYWQQTELPNKEKTRLSDFIEAPCSETIWHLWRWDWLYRDMCPFYLDIDWLNQNTAQWGFTYKTAVRTLNRNVRELTTGCSSRSMRLYPNGFWGPVTATIDWCEPNYVVSQYVAEFFNTTSCIVHLLLGVGGCVSCLWMRCMCNCVFLMWILIVVAEWRFFIAHCATIVIGLGSIAFHGTLLFECQLFDELPMLYGALVFFYIVTENERKQKVPPL